MPKRKKSHEYCRNRFGIFNKRRRVSGADHRCEECVTRALAARQRRKSVDRPGEVGAHPPVHESSSRGTVSPCLAGIHQNTACDCHQFSTEMSTVAPSLNRGNSSASRKMTLHSDSVVVGNFPTATLEDISESSVDVAMSSSCETSSTALDHYAKASSTSSIAFGQTSERGRTVSSLVALTSSLKLTEGRHPVRVSDAVHSHKMHMDISPVQELTTKLPPPVAAQQSADQASAATSVNIPFANASPSKAMSHKPPIHMHCGVYEPRRYVGSHRFPFRHGQRLLPSPPRVNMVREPLNNSDDSDEGFCEPAAKRSHRLSSDGDSLAEPDEGVNVVEKLLPNPMRHRRMEYTNHSLDASLGCTCSLYWQMMSNQYGVPTKIYTMERSQIIRPFDGHSHSIPRVNTGNQNWDASMFGWTPKPTSPGSNISFDYESSGTDSNRKSSNFDCGQQSGIFAIGNLVQDHSNVHGAIGLCLQHAIHCNKSVFVFDSQTNPNAPGIDESGNWYQYCRAKSMFVPSRTVPMLTQNFAGLGANELTEAARNAIKAIFQKTFGAP